MSAKTSVREIPENPITISNVNYSLKYIVTFLLTSYTLQVNKHKPYGLFPNTPYVALTKKVINKVGKSGKRWRKVGKNDLILLSELNR